MMTNVTHDTNYLDPVGWFFGETSKGESMSDRTRVGPQPLRQRLVDDGYVMLTRILIREISPFEQRRLHRCEVVGCDCSLIDFETCEIPAFGVSGDTFECERSAPVIAAQRELRDCRG